MKSYKISKNNSILLIIVILVISLLTNVYNSVMNSRYRLLIGKETYKSVEEIRTRNESVVNTLDKCIKSKSISNEELLALYKNFTSISDEYTNLWFNYRDYGKEQLISLTKKSKIPNELPNEVYRRIESLLFEYLTFEMKNHNDKIILEGDSLNNFSAAYNMSNELNNFYNEFNESKKIKDINKKEVIYIKEEYWIEVLKGINSTIEPYLDYEFTIKD